MLQCHSTQRFPRIASPTLEASVAEVATAVVVVPVAAETAAAAAATAAAAGSALLQPGVQTAVHLTMLTTFIMFFLF